MVAALFYIPPNNAQGCNFFISSPTIAIFCVVLVLSMIASLIGVVVPL
jgi:hypothetical protein